MLIVLCCAFPLALIPLWVAPRKVRLWAGALSPFAAVPALLAALAGPTAFSAGASELFLGATFGLDRDGRIFLLLTALLWTAAGIYARGYLRDDPNRARFFVLFLAASAGNLGVVVALDVVTFYTGFSMMTFAAYGLVVHSASPPARRAARVYLVMAVAAELLLLVAFLLCVHRAGTLQLSEVRAAVGQMPKRNLVMALLFAGFGVKAGALPLHMWLPLAHPVAPTPASAVLSGCMIKAGLLGWLRFFPLGHLALPDWGSVLVGLGLSAAFYGVVVGLMQVDSKTILAYSSISQMGLINVAVGVGLASPDAWPFASGTVALWALHHGLAKGALFLGAGVALSATGRAQVLAKSLLVLPALALAGAPLTSGWVAKEGLKSLAPQAPWMFASGLYPLLALSSVATTLLMGRLLVTTWRAPASSRPPSGWQWAGWLLLLLGVAFGALTVAFTLGVTGWPKLGVEGLWSSSWPVVLGALLVLGITRSHWRAGVAPLVQPGDILLLAEAVGRALSRPAKGAWRLMEVLDRERAPGPLYRWRLPTLQWLGRVEVGLTRWRTAGLLLLALLASALGLLWGNLG